MDRDTLSQRRGIHFWANDKFMVEKRLPACGSEYEEAERRKGEERGEGKKDQSKFMERLESP